MAGIILEKDTWKIGFQRKAGILLMTLTGFVLLFFIISNFVWLFDYDEAVVRQTLIDRKVVEGIPTVLEMDAWVRFNVLMAIVGNTLILATFSGMVWWGLRKKRFGFIFGVMWGVIFLVNTFSIPFYSIQADAYSIISAVLHFALAVVMFIWIIKLMQHRTNLRVALAKGKYHN